MTDVESLKVRLAHHQAMVVKLEDTRPELALIWLEGMEILTKQLASWGSDLANALPSDMC